MIILWTCSVATYTLWRPKVSLKTTGVFWSKGHTNLMLFSFKTTPQWSPAVHIPLPPQLLIFNNIFTAVSQVYRTQHQHFRCLQSYVDQESLTFSHSRHITCQTHHVLLLLVPGVYNPVVQHPERIKNSLSL